jgi:hypothetical protein
MEGLGIEAPATCGDPGQRLPALDFLRLAQPCQDVEMRRDALLLGHPKVAAELCDIQVQQLAGHLGAASAARGHEARYQDTSLGPFRLGPLGMLAQRRQGDIEVAAAARGTDEPPQPTQGPPHAPSAGLAGQEREDGAKPPIAHPHLVDRLFVARQRFRELPEEEPDPLAQKQRAFGVAASLARWRGQGRIGDRAAGTRRALRPPQCR